MKNELIKLTRVLLESDLSSSIYDDTYIIDETASKFNKLLDIKKGSDDELITTHISETVISPIAFYGLDIKKKFDIVCMSLSPSIHPILIRLEKQGAGEKWNDYFNFYTSEKILDHIYKLTANDYTNIGKLIYALTSEHGTSKVSIEDIKKDLGVEKKEIITTLMKNNSIIFSHIMPFHSIGFNTNMNGIKQLRKNSPGYDKYLDDLLNFIKNSTKDNGIILSTGYENSKVVHSLLAENNAESLVDNQLLTVQKWASKYAVLFNDNLYTRHGLRSDTEIDAVVIKIKALIDGSETVDGLNKFCDKLINDRSEEEFKSRGKRIKGSKVKKFEVKSFRTKKVFDRKAVTKSEFKKPVTGNHVKEKTEIKS